jgi:hypothetical protein
VFADALGADGPVAVVAEWSRGTLVGVELDLDGAEPVAGDVAPLVTGIDQPMAVLASADGSLLAGDWGSGTIYRIA